MKEVAGSDANPGGIGEMAHDGIFRPGYDGYYKNYFRSDIWQKIKAF
jgi:hypothetical protein